jgi:hypothetical protein
MFVHYAAAVGHYIAHCLRSNGAWESYDDVKDKPYQSPCSSLMPLLLTYVKEACCEQTTIM